MEPDLAEVDEAERDRALKEWTLKAIERCDAFDWRGCRDALGAILALLVAG